MIDKGSKRIDDVDAVFGRDQGEEVQSVSGAELITEHLNGGNTGWLQSGVGLVGKEGDENRMSALVVNDLDEALDGREGDGLLHVGEDEDSVSIGVKVLGDRVKAGVAGRVPEVELDALVVFGVMHYTGVEFDANGGLRFDDLAHLTLLLGLQVLLLECVQVAATERRGYGFSVVAFFEISEMIRILFILMTTFLMAGVWM